MTVLLVDNTKVVGADIAATVTDATYRQLNNWVSAGWLTPAKPSCGSGDYVGWSYADLVCVTIIQRLSAVGMRGERAKAAVELARPMIPPPDTVTVLVLCVTVDDVWYVEDGVDLDVRFRYGKEATVVLPLYPLVQQVRMRLRRYAPEMMTP